jgi:hypothetical protein
MTLYLLSTNHEISSLLQNYLVITIHILSIKPANQFNQWNIPNYEIL